jgi:hypothetical protein
VPATPDPASSEGIALRAGTAVASSMRSGRVPAFEEPSMRIPSRALLRGLAPGSHAATRRERAQRAIAAVAVSIATGARPAPDEPDRARDARKPPGG